MFSWSMLLPTSRCVLGWQCRSAPAPGRPIHWHACVFQPHGGEWGGLELGGISTCLITLLGAPAFSYAWCSSHHTSLDALLGQVCWGDPVACSSGRAIGELGVLSAKTNASEQLPSRILVFSNSSVSFFFMPRDARGVRTPMQRVRWHSTGPDCNSGRAAALPGPGAGRAVAAAARLLTSCRVLLGRYVRTGCLLVVWLVQGCVGSCCHQHTVAIIMTTACFVVWEPLTLNV